MDLRALILSRRDALGWSTYRLAKESGVPQQSLQAWLAGDRRELGSDKLGRVLAAMGGRVTFPSR